MPDDRDTFYGVNVSYFVLMGMGLMAVGSPSDGVPALMIGKAKTPSTSGERFEPGTPLPDENIILFFTTRESLDLLIDELLDLRMTANFGLVPREALEEIIRKDRDDGAADLASCATEGTA